jgi:hypothetical protein
MTATPIYDSLDLPTSDVDTAFRWDHPQPSGHGAGDEATLTQVAAAAGEPSSTSSPAATTSTEESAL